MEGTDIEQFRENVMRYISCPLSTHNSVQVGNNILDGNFLEKVWPSALFEVYVRKAPLVYLGLHLS